MFEQQLRKAFEGGHQVTIFTYFGSNRGSVTACHDGWFTFTIMTNNSKVNVYYEDVMMLIEHDLD